MIWGLHCMCFCLRDPAVWSSNSTFIWFGCTTTLKVSYCRQLLRSFCCNGCAPWKCSGSWLSSFLGLAMCQKHFGIEGLQYAPMTVWMEGNIWTLRQHRDLRQVPQGLINWIPFGDHQPICLIRLFNLGLPSGFACVQARLLFWEGI